MDWDNARWVKLYCLETGTWLRLGWQGRTLALHLLRAVNASGVLSDLGDEPELILAELLRLPVEVVSPGIAALLRTETITLANGVLVWRKFVEAQKSRKSEAQRKAEYRAKHRADAIKAQGGTDCPESGTASPETNSECPECPTSSGQNVPEEKGIERGELKRKDSLVTSEPKQPELELVPQLTADAKKPSAAQVRDQTALILFTELNQARLGVVAGSRAMEPRTAALAGLKACLAQGYSPDEIRRVIALKVAECRTDPSQAKWFTPTWFRPGNVDRYLALRPQDVTSARPSAGNGYQGRPAPQEPPKPVMRAESDFQRRKRELEEASNA